ncbi:hypothetical protein K443DRAFT_7631 [Laccaria amethystina LaAM-08-1]|uniref:Uncharacterized protein n=1 Tax=Laccaria amethystina LaAM-08-1 TaxID=1095629 RepID=A0A0C9WQH0_9AGAR|nr:hypothetical protein K443DRAFT_7631 [Laccaria amethystina LaAM-08-1]
MIPTTLRTLRPSKHLRMPPPHIKLFIFNLGGLHFYVERNSDCILKGPPKPTRPPFHAILVKQTQLGRAPRTYPTFVEKSPPITFIRRQSLPSSAPESSRVTDELCTREECPLDGSVDALAIGVLG